MARVHRCIVISRGSRSCSFAAKSINELNVIQVHSEPEKVLPRFSPDAGVDAATPKTAPSLPHPPPSHSAMTNPPIFLSTSRHRSAKLDDETSYHHTKSFQTLQTVSSLEFVSGDVASRLPPFFRLLIHLSGLSIEIDRQNYKQRKTKAKWSDPSDGNVCFL